MPPQVYFKAAFLFFARTPHVSKSLNGLRGRKHRQVYPALISLAALNGDCIRFVATVNLHKSRNINSA